MKSINIHSNRANTSQIERVFVKSNVYLSNRISNSRTCESINTYSNRTYVFQNEHHSVKTSIIFAACGVSTFCQTDFHFHYQNGVFPFKISSKHLENVNSLLIPLIPKFTSLMFLAWNFLQISFELVLLIYVLLSIFCEYKRRFRSFPAFIAR